MKNVILPILFIVFFCVNVKAAQVFNFSYNNISDVYPPYTYNLQTTVTVVGIKIGTIYYDDGSIGSFAYSLVLSYSNTLTPVSGTMPTSNGGNFSEYQFTATSNTGQMALTNNFSVPFSTGNGILTLSGNTYSGSASSFGYTAGNTYADAATLSRFGFSSLSLSELAPNGANLQTRNSSAILPVSLIYFNATLNNGRVLLDWATATETNSNYFTVERSSSNDEFRTIQNIDSHINSNSQLNYSFIDNYPLVGSSFYRLKETDLDGNVTYSATVAVNNPGISNHISIYPTLNNSNIVYFSGNVDGKILDVFSITGRKLFSMPLKGTQQTLPSMAKGIYMFRITSSDKTDQVSKYVQQ